MGSNCSRIVAQNLRDELWSYTALSGLLFLHIGIVLMVYALKRATPHTAVIKTFGIGLITLGVLATLASWYAHRQHRLQRDLCLCCTCSCCLSAPVKKVSGGDSASGVKAPSRMSVFGKPKAKEVQPTPEFTLKMFAAPEFQRYAEFINGSTAGVQQGARTEPQRQKKTVHPESPRDLPLKEIYINPRSLQNQSNLPSIHPIPSPILLQLSK
ncbi:hypothetical protein Bpfe_021897 [Biomphalaria pfeifferi]|uniref:Uncharacterized protein n=1 Tax=Biomphalaria pfeifferi TaxID=112525 RepID=A0AAD8F1U2_BIOPF|nr:hypothetical protein Bpfe_021897 [Biomphalaria pfeifferi]